ncbi:rCG37289 [Rattus norvegicus]|uniref:RCG37289 n=1 Tax=Rattus norvegicus TaxID=10116 RepID=A6KIB8_RAT|nr:rCG37289 [Rattus norvegicus]
MGASRYISSTSSSVNRSPMVVSSSRRWSSWMNPEASSSKQAKALRITSSGSVPFSFSPNIVRNMVKLIGPGASFIIPSRYSSVGFFPVGGQHVM